MSNENLERLILDLKESLERDLGELNRKVDGFISRVDTQSIRLDRHAGPWQSSRMDQGAERIDAALETKDIEIAQLRKRIAKLESNDPAA